MKHKWRTTAIVAAIGLAILGVLAFNFKSMQESDVESYRKELRAAGEKLTIAEVIPSKVPPSENSAQTFRDAAAKLKSVPSFMDTNSPWPMFTILPGKAMIGWKQPEVHCDITPEPWSELERFAVEQQDALNLLRQIIDKPVLDFAPDYSKGPMTLLPDLAPVKNSSRALSAVTLLELHRGNTAAAVKDIRAMLALVIGLHDERFAISQLVRFANVNGASVTTWELLQAPDLTEEQLEALQKDWSRVECMQGAENAFIIERAMIDMRVGFGTVEHGDSNWKDSARFLLWKALWSSSDHLRALKAIQIMVEGARAVQTNYNFTAALLSQSNRLQTLNARMGTGWDWADDVAAQGSLVTDSVKSLSGVMTRLMRAEIVRQVTTTAIALKRYQLKHGEYPLELQALVPEFLPTVPLDPLDGKTLRYLRRPDGTFLLYSIGANGIDDGGSPEAPDPLASPYPVSPPVEESISPRERAAAAAGRRYRGGGYRPSYSWLSGPDYVWPSPATEAEIEAFEAGTSKP